MFDKKNVVKYIFKWFSRGYFQADLKQKVTFLVESRYSKSKSGLIRDFLVKIVHWKGNKTKTHPQCITS